MIVIPQALIAQMGEQAVAGYPYEVCGLMIGAGDRVERYVPCTNVAASARVYTIDPKEHLKAELSAEKDGLEVIGVVHSHTHSEAYPSPTDVAQAPDPGWHYVIVSLKSGQPAPRSYRIVNGEIAEEEIVNS